AQTLPGGDIHTSFRLPANGGQIGLYGVDGALVDGVTYGVENTDISEGRFPDGADAPFFLLTSPSPKAANNAQAGNRAPVLAPIASASVDEGALLSFRSTAVDPDIPAQILTFAVAAGAPAGSSMDPATGVFSWTPSEEQGPGTYVFTVIVTDDGQPA